MLFRDMLTVETEEKRFYDITKQINEIVAKSGIKDGLCHVFVQSTTSALWLNENDRLLVEDIKRLLAELAPSDRIYQHPDNAHSHLRATMLKNEHTIPVANGRLAMGTWQSLLLWNFDTRKRERKIVVSVGN